MPVAKKVGLVLAVLAAGGSLALFFRKDASPIDSNSELAADGLFGERVQRRVAKSEAPRPRLVAAPEPAPRHPVRMTSATASISEPANAAAKTPAFQTNFSPVGALLAPIDGVADDHARIRSDDARNEDVDDDQVGGYSSDSQRSHIVIDGDTLSKLAIEYFGRADRYLEIFELNRDKLKSPDLLPIGAALKIPSRGGTAQPPSVPVSPP